MKTNYVLVMALVLLAPLAAEASSQNVLIGRFQTRAIWTPPSSNSKSPVVILIPGSGANGPEERVPGSMTLNGQDTNLFADISAPLNEAGVATLALGKPGIEFFTTWDKSKYFYDVKLYANLHWKDLLSNLADAIAFVKSQPGVDPTKVFILGHSEGTQVAVDAASLDPTIKGIILLGYAGQDLSTLVDWQIFRRPIDDLVATDMDSNHDGLLSKAEAARWPEFTWNWLPGQDQISFPEIEAVARQDQDSIAFFEKAKNTPLYQDGIFTRGSLIELTASLPQDVYVFNGDLDENTPVQDSIALRDACARAAKKNCSVTILPGLGHAFSAPKPPRAQRLLDSTLGPIDPAMQKLLLQLGNQINKETK